jgi:hypothetical protein
VVVVVGGAGAVNGEDCGTVGGVAAVGDDPNPDAGVVVGGFTVGGASLAGAGAKVVRPVNTARAGALEGCESAACPAAVVTKPSVDAASAMTMAAVRPKHGHVPTRW